MSTCINPDGSHSTWACWIGLILEAIALENHGLIHLLLIIIVATVLVADVPDALPLLNELNLLSIAVWSIGPLVVIALVQHVCLALCGRGLDRTGNRRYLRRADYVLLVARLGVATSHIISVVVLGWLEAVRGWIGGNLVLVDESLVILPPVLVIVAGWVSYAPIDRRLHEAMLLRALDEQAPLPNLPRLRHYVSEQVRHQLLLILIPISAILAWTESVDWAAARWSGDPIERLDGPWPMALLTVHLLGVLGIVATMPLALRLIWRTVPLGPGPLRTRLMALCKAQGVRCRELLIWRTHLGLLNGAVIGILPQLRFILLTETLLERLTESEIEAVMAHEVAHARRHHLPWLMVGLMASVGGAWLVAALLIGPAGVIARSSADDGLWLELLALGAALAVGLFAFGYISRRFEQQADAFAAQHFSGVTRATRGTDGLSIAPEATQTMALALGKVAAFNCIDPARFMWRHGSIQSRQRRLARLVGQPAASLPIDRVVRHLKAASLAVLAVVVIASAVRPDLLPM